MRDLEWLAENVETWPNGAIGVEARIRYSNLDAYYYELFYIKAPIVGLGATVYTREQWQEERYRLGLDKHPAQRITLQAGDYIETKGVSEADYKKVYDAFCNAAIYARKEEPSYHEAVGLDYFGASLFRQTNCYHSGLVADENIVVFTRLLTVDQVINATNAKPQPGEWIEWSGGECPVSYETVVECRTERDPEGADTRPACEWDWNTKTNPITHYRIVDKESTDAGKDDTEMVDISYQEKDGGVAIITAPSPVESLDTLHAEVIYLQKEMAHIEAIMIEKKARIMEILGDVFEG